MATNTPNYNLKKPDADEFYNVADQNGNMDKIDAALKAIDEKAGNIDLSELATKEELQTVNQEVVSHQADYEYQTPNIVGTQIRLTKQSTSNRLFFKLSNPLNGSITISLDNGATSKPLVDTDGNPVTSLEKGFVEVIADASFFILRNRGSSLSTEDMASFIAAINGILSK